MSTIDKVSINLNPMSDTGHTYRSNQPIMIPIPTRAFPNHIHIRHGSLEVIIHGNASSRTALNAGRLGQLVPQFDSDGAYGKVRFVRSTVL